MHFPNLRAPSLAIWIGAAALCVLFGLVALTGLDPIPVMIVCAVVILCVGAVRRSRGYPRP